MKFIKFSSLDNTYKETQVKKAEALNIKDWVVFEKLDGANFSFWYDGVELRIASRNQFIDGGFYGCADVVEKYAPLVKEGYHALGLDGHTLVLFGELFGGGILNRVSYGEKDFAAFDIVVEGNPQSVSFLENFCKVTGLPIAPILAKTGTLTQALEYNNTFSSTKTPEGVEGDNFAEGVTIVPENPSFYKGNESRVWFKNKSESFVEKGSKKAKEVVELSEQDNELLAQLSEFVTSSRVFSVISKLGEVSAKDFPQVQSLTMLDVLDDFEGHTGEVADNIAKDWKAVYKVLGKLVSMEIRRVLFK